MFYGLMAGGDVKLSKICRAYRPTITMKKAGDRLCMYLDDEGSEKTLHSFLARNVARRIKSDTLIIVDPSDIRKPYATQMDFLSKVWDGSKGAVGDNLGYYGCKAVACENGGRKPMPLHLRFWSPDAPGFTSENDELESAVEDGSDSAKTTSTTSQTFSHFSGARNDYDNDTSERKIPPPREIRPYFQKQLSHLLKPTKAHFALYLQGCRLFVVRKNGQNRARYRKCSVAREKMGDLQTNLPLDAWQEIWYNTRRSERKGRSHAADRNYSAPAQKPHQRSSAQRIRRVFVSGYTLSS